MATASSITGDLANIGFFVGGVVAVVALRPAKRAVTMLREVHAKLTSPE